MEAIETTSAYPVGNNLCRAPVLKLFQGYRLNVGAKLVTDASTKLDNVVVVDVDAVVVVSPLAPDADMIATAMGNARRSCRG